MTALVLSVVERDVMAYRRMWLVFLTGFFEPFFFLLSIGVGVGQLVGTVHASGSPVDYQTFVAPGLLATSAMNGAAFDATFNFFFKFKYSKSFAAMLSTPLQPVHLAWGELVWALSRSTLYSAAFLVTMWGFGLTASPLAVFALPGAMLIGFAFAGAGMAATTWMRSFVDFDYVNLTLVPLFLFSGVFFPLSQYPTALGWVVRGTPLYQGVALERALVLGHVGLADVGHVAYLAVVGAVGLAIAGRRLGLLLQP